MKAAHRRSAMRSSCGVFWRSSAPETLQGVRIEQILATLLYHGIRHEELCLLRLRDLQSRQGVMHFRVKGERDKIHRTPN